MGAVDHRKNVLGTYFIFVYMIAWISTCVYVLLYTWNGELFLLKQNLLVGDEKLHLLKSFLYALFGGVLGSVSYCLYSFILYFGQNKFDFSTYKWWYVYRPIQGGMLGITVYVLIIGGLFSFGTNTGKIGIENNYTLFGISFLAGYAVEQVLGRIKEICVTIFGSTKQREHHTE